MADSHLRDIRKLMPETTVVNRGAAKKIAARLEQEEQVLAGTVGSLGGPGGASALIVATDRRLFVASSFLLSATFMEFPYERLNSVEVTGVEALGVGQGMLRINAGGGGTVLNVLDLGGAQRVASAAGSRIGSMPVPVYATAQAGPSMDAVGALEKLAQLHRDGLVTDAEFADKKADLLARI